MTSEILPEGEKQIWTYDIYGDVLLHQTFSADDTALPVATSLDTYDFSNTGHNGRLLYTTYDADSGVGATQEEVTTTYNDSASGLGQVSEITDQSRSTSSAPPAGLPPTITLSAADSPTGAPLTLVWTNEVSPYLGPEAGGGYVNDPSYDWAIWGWSDMTEVALISPTAMADAVADGTPAGEWGLVTGGSEHDYILSGSTFTFDPTSPADQSVDGYIGPSTISIGTLTG
jgi:hypothetical protein